ncbi:protein of unknown function [Enhydrobacter aerosaccus]|uniref:DUF4267 domain-containing protein n=1 Tax=Enhydrobacter aerosaccus TaxID=225324 RepID=A0A1T4PCX0_9HYPH|nr:DUF4267 domain-containing protein [Enhydrobacter aerosaccus]SJZ89339.1 protein of unknown function [Enhydrobacter aerosaccus]
MSTDVVARELSWTSPLPWLSVIVLGALFAIGVRAVMAPATAASGFGIPLTEGNGLAYVQAFGARNIGLGLFALLAIALDQRRSVGIFFLCAAVIALIDAYVVSRHLGFGLSIARPAVIALVLAALGGFLLR